MSVRDPDVIGIIILVALIGGIITKTILLEMVSTNVNPIAQMIIAVEHLNGHFTIVVGGSMENVKINLRLQ